MRKGCDVYINTDFPTPFRSIRSRGQQDSERLARSARQHIHAILERGGVCGGGARWKYVGAWSMHVAKWGGCVCERES